MIGVPAHFGNSIYKKLAFVVNFFSSQQKRVTLVVDLGGERISVHCYRECRTYVRRFLNVSFFLESNYVWEKMY